ncbi:peptidoglycan recognition protein family protein, partial [Gilliamella sp. Choc4-2]|uniref:peptidoglycan recognition protein family protein n=1 Tax=Gilliamella sp. Choc4-2 TaxID=3120237 RepID=UPI000ACFFFF8
EQIGHLLVKYESEWYADEELSKWNEIDNLYEQEKQQKKEIIEEELNKLGLTLPYQRDSAMKKVDEAHEYVKSNWQLEKEERIKPSLWWKEVAQAQAQNQTTSTEQSEANTPKLTNLSTNGKAWFIHPVAMMDYFKVEKNKGVCPITPDYRSHFVLHCTDGNMSEETIKAINNVNNPDKKIRSKAHKYIMRNGDVIEIWPFTEKNVWATKAESRNNLKGRMFHVEINYKSPDVPTDNQYQALADLYIEASDIEGCWPIIVPHIEVDRGIPNGHGDPTDFDYNKFYSILRSRNVPIDDIPHFEHKRYWGYSKSKIPFANDKYSWPPILSGNPHKK